MVNDEKPLTELEMANRTIAALREDNELHEDFVVKCTELLPPSYDADEAAEAIILHFLKDMQEIGRIVAKLTADYR